MQLFKNVLDECDFMDLGFVGFPFTWHKHYADYMEEIIQSSGNKWVVHNVSKN